MVGIGTAQPPTSPGARRTASGSRPIERPGGAPAAIRAREARARENSRGVRKPIAECQVPPEMLCQLPRQSGCSPPLST